MADKFTATVKVEGMPKEVRAGEVVNIAAEVLNPSDEVKSVYVSVPAAGLYESLRKGEDGVYRTRFDVPYGGGGGVYSVNFFAVNNNNERSDVVTFDVRAF